MTTELERSPSKHATSSHIAVSLRFKLLVFAALLVIVPGVLFGAIVQWSGNASMQELIGRHLAREAAQTRDRFVANLRGEREALRNFARQDLMREIRVGDIDKRISNALATLRDGEPARIDYLVLDLGDQVVASSHPKWIGTEPDWLRRRSGRAMSAGRFEGPVAIPSLGGEVVWLETPIADPDRPERLLGRLVGIYDWGGLTRVLHDVERDLGEHEIRAEVVLAGLDGRVLGGTGGSRVEASLGRAAWVQLAEFDEGRSNYSILGDTGMLVGRAELGPEFPDAQLLIVDPFSDAFTPVRDLTRRIGLLLGLLLVVALVIATIAGRRVVKPLAELTSAVRGLSLAGLSSFRVPVRSEDEVGTLANAFNRMASELDQAQSALVEAAKFALVGELAAGVAHELRTSLGVLRSSVQMVERALPDDDDHELKELAHLIRAEVDRLGGIVNELLELGRPRSPRLERIALAAPIERAIDLVQAQATAAGVEISRPPCDPRLEVVCDVEMIHQVALNLLVNAIQAIGSGGRVDVRLFETEDGRVGFEIEDDGPGIAPELLDRIFRPFASGREGGIGLGLTFVQRVVYEHQGRVDVQSEPGSGTRFRVELPRAGDRR